MKNLYIFYIYFNRKALTKRQGPMKQRRLHLDNVNVMQESPH